MDTKYVRKRNQRRYLAEVIDFDYWQWKGRKIFLSAPTGMGKTTFVVNVLLDQIRNRGKKMLILCNRRLLRMQYWYSIIQQFVSYAEIEACVEIMTYQQLAEMVKHGNNLRYIFSRFEMIVCDESHFFYADADFNGIGTYVLLHELVEAGAFKTMVFMSATMEEVRPLIERTLKNCFWRVEITDRNIKISKENSEILTFDFSMYDEYSRFNCIYSPDWESMYEIFTESTKRSLIFINNKEKGKDLMDKLLKTGKIEKSQIAFLNADNIDADNEIVQALSIGNRLNVKILITTAVLDNGVSIHDSQLGNVVIETDLKIEFLQMLGRIRAEGTDACNLYFIQRDKNDFSRRMNRYKKELDYFEKLQMDDLSKHRNFYLQEIMADGEMASFYKKALVWMKFDSQFYDLPENGLWRSCLESDLYINRFAECKTGDMYVAESRLYALAVTDPLQVVYAQMSWIGKTSEELEIMESGYRERRREKFIARLLQCQNYALEDLKDFKVSLVREFRKDFFNDITAKNGTISNEKLCEICNRCGLIFESREDAKTRMKIYDIKNEFEGEEGC